MNIRVQGICEAKRIAGVIVRAHEGFDDEKLKPWMHDCAARIKAAVKAERERRKKK